MKTWAENEVELACKRENPDRKDGEFDYGCACYESALKAYNSLTEYGHSECSIKITMNILNRIVEGKPLTPIDDTDDIWSHLTHGYFKRNYVHSYQCKRMSSLFKDVYEDGSVKYSDINRVSCVNIHSGISYHNGLVSNIIDEMFPITMPYYPETSPIKVYCEEFLFDENNGDFDTMGVLYAIMPNGERIDIDRYFAEIDNELKEIDEQEYFNRKAHSVEE